MRHRPVMTAAAVGAAALLLAGCKTIEAQSRSEITQESSKGGATSKSVQRVYIVQDGDTLSGIAERECGDGASVVALMEANVGRKQPDGRAMKDPDQLRVGWKLVVSC